MKNVTAAASWLASAFGFREVLRWAASDGTVMLADMELAGGVVLLTHPGPDYQNPRRHGRVFQITSVFIDDVDKQFERAIVAGASIVSKPEDKPWGLRECRVDDPEGHRWELLQHIRDVSPEDWGATVTAKQRHALAGGLDRRILTAQLVDLALGLHGRTATPSATR